VTAHALQTYGFREMHIHEMTDNISEEGVEVMEQEVEEQEENVEELEEEGVEEVKESSNRGVIRHVSGRVPVINDSDDDSSDKPNSTARYPTLGIIDDSQHDSNDPVVDVACSCENHGNKFTHETQQEGSSEQCQSGQQVGEPGPSSSCNVEEKEMLHVQSESPLNNNPTSSSNQHTSPSLPVGVVGSDGIMKFYSPSWNPPESSNRENSTQNHMISNVANDANTNSHRFDGPIPNNIQNNDPNWKGKEKEKANENNRDNNLVCDVIEQHNFAPEGHQVNKEQPSVTANDVIEEIRATQNDTSVIDLCQLIARNQPVIARMNQTADNHVDQQNGTTSTIIANPYSSTVQNAPDVMSQFIHNGIHPSQVCFGDLYL